MSAIASLRDSTMAVSTAAAAGGYGSVTISVPTHSTSDILTMFVMGGRSGAYLADAVAQGWELAYYTAGQSSVFQKVASAAEPASYTFQVSDNSAGTAINPACATVTMVAWVPGTLAYNEVNPLTTGPGWTIPLNGTPDYAPSPVGWTDTGDGVDTSTVSYQDLVFNSAVTSGTTTGAAYSLPTIGVYAGTYDTLFGSELVQAELNFGGGFKTKWEYSKWAHKASGAGSLTIAYSGGSGNYLMADQPFAVWQAWMTLDPNAVPTWNADYGDGARLDYTAKTVAVRALPYDIGRLLRRN